MLEKLSTKAIRVVMFAQEEARKLDNALVGTEHLLLGILKDELGIAAKVLKYRGLDYNQIRESIAQITPIKRYTVGREIHFSNHAKQVFELAEDETSRLGEEQVESEHILLGLVALGEGYAVKILEEKGLNLIRLRWNILRVRKELETGIDAIQTPSLDKYSYDLTNLLEKDRTTSVVERVDLIEKVLQGLGGYNKPFVLLIGGAGVGTSSIIKGLTQYIIEGKVYSQFLNFRVVELNLPFLLAELGTDKTLYTEIRNILNEIIQTKDIILIIEDIHKLFLSSPDKSEYIIARQILPKIKGENNFPFIGTTKPEFYDSLKSAGITEYFSQSIFVPEPKNEELLAIIEFWKSKLEKYHTLKIDESVLPEAIKISKNYRKDRYLPSSALLLLDGAAAKKRLNRAIAQLKIREIERHLRKFRQEREVLGQKKDIDGLEKLKVIIKEKEEEIKKFTLFANPDGNFVLTIEDIQLICQ